MLRGFWENAAWENDPNLLPLDSIVSEGEQSHDQIYLSTNWLTKSLQIDRAVSWKESGSSKPLFWRQDLTYFNSTLPVMSYITFSFLLKPIRHRSSDSNY